MVLVVRPNVLYRQLCNRLTMLMKLYTAVYNLMMCMKENIPGLKSFMAYFNLLILIVQDVGYPLDC